jgi:hypothetical protein
VTPSSFSSRFAVNNIFTVAFCSKLNHVSHSRVTVNGITLMTGPMDLLDHKLMQTLKLHMVGKLDFFSNLFKFKQNPQTSRKIFLSLVIRLPMMTLLYNRLWKTCPLEISLRILFGLLLRMTYHVPFYCVTCNWYVEHNSLDVPPTDGNGLTIS